MEHFRNNLILLLIFHQNLSDIHIGSLRSPLATCLLIRYTSSLLQEDMGSANARASYQFLENCLRHKNEMVNSHLSNQ